MLIKEIEWRQLLISVAIAFAICFIFASVLFFIKQFALEYSLNNSIIDFPEPEEYESSYNDYINSTYWIPFELLIVFATYYVSSRYLVERCKYNKYLNIALNFLFISVFVYQLNAIAILGGCLISFYVAYKAVKSNKEAQ